MVWPFSDQQYRHESYYNFLFKYKSFIPRITSNFRHLLSCGTIDSSTTHCQKNFLKQHANKSKMTILCPYGRFSLPWIVYTHSFRPMKSKH